MKTYLLILLILVGLMCPKSNAVNFDGNGIDFVTCYTNIPFMTGNNSYSGTQTFPSMIIGNVTLMAGLYTNNNVMAVNGSGQIINIPITSLVTSFSGDASQFTTTAGVTSIKNGANGTNLNLSGTTTNVNIIATGINSFTNNYAKYNVILSPSPAVAFATSWTNTYGSRVQLTVDGTITLVIAGTSTITYTNLTTTESHIVAGSSISIAGVNNWSTQVYLSPNDVIRFNSALTGLAAASITKSTVTLVQ